MSKCKKKLADYKCKSPEITVKRCSVNIEQSQLELINHPDRSFVDYLIDGFVHGFKTGISSLPAHSFECRNLQSANRYTESTSELIETELNKGYIIGPYDTNPYSQSRINPVGIAVGKYSGKKRPIVDMSTPHDNDIHPSLNKLINKEEFSLYYVTIDDAIRIIKKTRKRCINVQVNIMDAFKNLNVAEHLWPYQGIKWNNKYYFYTR